MVKVGDWVILKGKTRHGKNRIQQHGMEWVVKSVSTFQGQPAMNLCSANKTEGPKGNKGLDGRWVLLKNDNNFEWEFLSKKPVIDEETERKLQHLEHMEIITGRF